jgi:hypothetical protein
MYILEGILLILQLLLMITGIVLVILSMKHTKPEPADFNIWNPRHWKESFTKRGLRYHYIGNSMVAFSACLHILYTLVLFPK